MDEILDRKTACAILGLDENASMEDIEKAYEIFLRRKMQQQREGKSESDDEQFQKYTAAYSYLKGDTVLKRKTPTGKLLNWLNYRKVPIIIGLVIVFVVGGMIRASFFREKPDLSVQIDGEIYTYTIGLDTIAKNLKAALPDIKTLNLGTTPLKHDGNDSNSVTNANKIFIDLALGSVDVFIIDKYIFDKYVNTGLFLSLDGFADSRSVPAEKRSGLSSTTKEDATMKLYGIDVTRSKILFDSGLAGNKKIFVIISRSKNVANAEKLGEILLPDSADYVPLAADPG
jgi:hypothetical protein